RESEVFSFVALELEFPVVAVLLADFQNEFSFTGRVKTEVEIIAHGAAVDLDYSVAGFEFHLGAEAIRRHFGNLYAAATDTCNCGCNGKLVHAYKTTFRSGEF